MYLDEMPFQSSNCGAVDGQIRSGHVAYSTFRLLLEFFLEKLQPGLQEVLFDPACLYLVLNDGKNPSEASEETRIVTTDVYDDARSVEASDGVSKYPIEVANEICNISQQLSLLLLLVRRPDLFKCHEQLRIAILEPLVELSRSFDLVSTRS
jgi:hypothetical protein